MLNCYYTIPVNSIAISGMLTPSHLHGRKWSQDGRPWKPILDVSFSLLRGLVRQFQSLTWLQLLVFVWFGFKSIPNHGKSVQDEILLDQFYIIEYSKGFKNTLWPEKCVKLSRDGKLTVKIGRAPGTAERYLKWGGANRGRYHDPLKKLNSTFLRRSWTLLILLINQKSQNSGYINRNNSNTICWLSKYRICLSDI